MIELSEQCWKQTANKRKFKGMRWTKTCKYLSSCSRRLSSARMRCFPLESTTVPTPIEALVRRCSSRDDAITVNQNGAPQRRNPQCRLHTVTVSQVPLKEAKLNWRAQGIWRCGTIVEPTNLIHGGERKEGRKEDPRRNWWGNQQRNGNFGPFVSVLSFQHFACFNFKQYLCHYNNMKN